MPDVCSVTRTPRRPCVTHPVWGGVPRATLHSNGAVPPRFARSGCTTARRMCPDQGQSRQDALTKGLRLGSLYGYISRRPLSLSRDGHDRGQVREGRGFGARKVIGRLLDNVKNIYILESNNAFLGAPCQGISLQSQGPSSNIAPIAQRWTGAATRIGKGSCTRPFHGNRYIMGGICRACEGGRSERKGPDGILGEHGKG